MKTEIVDWEGWKEKKNEEVEEKQTSGYKNKRQIGQCWQKTGRGILWKGDGGPGVWGGGRERKVQSDLEINKLGRGGHDGGTRNRQIRRRFPERAWRDQGLQSRTAEEMQIHRNKEVRWAKGGRKSTEKTLKEQVRIWRIIRAHKQFYQLDVINRLQKWLN